MQKKIISFLTVALLVVATSGLILPARAEDKPETKTPAKKPPTDQMPFHGKISAVDKSAKTITIEGKEKGRTIQVTAATRIRKAGKPATFDDATAGEDVGGLAKKSTDGKLEAISLRVGPKPEGEKKPSKPKAEKKKKEN